MQAFFQSDPSGPLLHYYMPVFFQSDTDGPLLHYYMPVFFQSDTGGPLAQYRTPSHIPVRQQYDISENDPPPPPPMSSMSFRKGQYEGENDTSPEDEYPVSHTRTPIPFRKASQATLDKVNT